MRTWLAATAALLLLTAGVARAQIAPGGGPLDISADTLEVDNAARKATYRGKVEVLQGGNRLRADSLDVYFASDARAGGDAAAKGPAAGAFGDIERLVASGDVYFVTPQQTVRGDQAVYTVASDTIVVTGAVVIAQGENVLKGDRLTIEVKTGRSAMDASGADRVRGVFFPDRRPANR